MLLRNEWGRIFILDFAIAKGMASGRIGGQIFILHNWKISWRK